MCGRYALALRPSQVRDMLQDDNMPVEDMPEDEGAGAPRQSYNFAPGYHGIVYRADTSDYGAGPRPGGGASADAGDKDDDADHEEAATQTPVSYKLQSMKWGLIPFWTKRSPDYTTMMRTINCRDDSLATPGGMWSTMKSRKRCIVIAQGFYEWLKTSSRERLPHFIKRKDGRLLCLAGLWDCVQYEGSEDKHYTYTIITTDSNKQMKFLHDRMPVVLEPGSDDIRTWLDPSRSEWSRDLQTLLKPFEGELEIYPVSKDVGKVGNDSPSFMTPLNSKENKANIANFFSSAGPKKQVPKTEDKSDTNSGLKQQESPEKPEKREKRGGKGPSVKEEEEEEDGPSPLKRKLSTTKDQGPPVKKRAPVTRSTRSGPISATHNETKTAPKSKNPGSQKITKFFGNKA